MNFIVRAVDDVLKSEFGLPMGLADNSKITINWDTGQSKRGKPVAIKKEVHRVQVLDPATGTGTFLAEVIKQIEPRIKKISAGQWDRYVEKELIPRLHGFELLMASYAMCHMKIDMILTELGYKPTGAPPRLEVYLTNSLEEGERDVRDLFMAQWLSQEAREANNVKRQQPIMCVIGNPPYSGISQNTGEWITNLIEDYKYIDGVHFSERKHWLHDDYVKFIRFAEYLIEKNGEGVVGFITNHGYLDNPTFRAMRWHLLQTFDQINVFDLHGNTNKKETAPDGSPDKNVFDIRQGVAILIAVKKKSNGKKAGARVFHSEIYGTRNEKQKTLWGDDDNGPEWTEIFPVAPYFMFYPVNSEALANYDAGFSLSEFMPVNQKGMITARDHLAIAFEKEELEQRIESFVDAEKTDLEVRRLFFPNKTDGKYLAGDTRGWSLSAARENMRGVDFGEILLPISYRPFDTRVVAYTQYLVDWPRQNFMHHFLAGENLGLMFNRGIEEQRPFTDAFVFSALTQHHSLSNKEANNIAPLYIFPEENSHDDKRRVNFDPTLWRKLKRNAKHPKRGTPNEIETFDYIYGVLSCPSYRMLYAEFLRMDFAHIPWPKTADEFWHVSDAGKELRLLHVMESQAIGETPYSFEGSGDSIVESPTYKDGRIWINKDQSFADVPQVAWDFYIGGYQPAQKWLKDRKGRELSFDDILHYQKIIKILSETDRIMKTITMDLT